jgi:hypothetical protein
MAKELAERALSMATAQEIEAHVQEVMGKNYAAELLDAAGEMTS